MLLSSSNVAVGLMQGDRVGASFGPLKQSQGGQGQGQSSAATKQVIPLYVGSILLLDSRQDPGTGSLPDNLSDGVLSISLWPITITKESHADEVSF